MIKVKIAIVITLVLIFGSRGFCEIVVISSMKGYSHIYQEQTQFFSDILLEVYGGNKYGGGLVLSPQSHGALSNISVNVEKVEFFVNVLGLFKVTYWYGNKEHLGYVSSFQTRFYQLDRDLDLRGWHSIDGTGIGFDIPLLQEALSVSPYFYRNSRGDDGAGSVGLKIVGRYRDVMLSVFAGASENVFRAGAELRTFFRHLNAGIVVGIDRLPFTNFSINVENIYALVEERLNFLSADGSWGFEQIVTFLIKPSFCKGVQRRQSVSDIDVRLLVGLSLFRNLLIGTEGTLGLYGLLLPVTQVGFSSEVGCFIGFEENNILIKIQPMFLVFNTTTNSMPPFRVSVLGELRF
ncbi:MAG: hypothetical protein ABDH28_04010 [Brevinematia bacterium]